MPRTTLISEARIRAYCRCPYSYRLSYVERLPREFNNRVSLNRLLSLSLDHYLENRPTTTDGVRQCVEKALTRAGDTREDADIENLIAAATHHVSEFAEEAGSRIPNDYRHGVALACRRNETVLTSRANVMWQDNDEWVVGIWTLWPSPQNSLSLSFAFLESGIRQSLNTPCKFLIVTFRPQFRVRSMSLNNETRLRALDGIDSIATTIAQEQRWMATPGHWCSSCHHRYICNSALIPVEKSCSNPPLIKVGQGLKFTI